MRAMISRMVERDYGIEATARGARVWARISSTRPTRPIATVGGYVAACRRLDYSLAWTRDGRPVRGSHDWTTRPPAVDGRLVAVGFRHVPPREWVLGDRRDGREPRRLTDFVAFWRCTQPRPNTVGSPYDASPEVAFAIWSAGPSVRRAATAIPAWNWSALLRWGNREWLPASEWAETRRAGGLRRRWLRHAVEIGRALRRSSLAGVGALRVSAQALRRLGALCPELQRVALRGAMERADAERGGACAVIRVRHLDWAAVARGAAALAHDRTGRVRAAMAYHERDDGGISLRFANLCSAASMTTSHQRWSAWLCPAYPGVTLAQAARLCRGESPVQVSGGQLTRREAHEWLSTAPELSPTEWLARGLSAECHHLRSAAVVRWLYDVRRRGGWGQLERERTLHGPAGQTVRWRFLDRVDEIQDVDLSRGVRTGVEEAFAHAAERLGSAWLEQNRGNHRVLASVPPRWRLYRNSMRPLVTPAQLIREGEEMHHCVGGYASAVEQGQSVILALSVVGHRSTVELSPDGRVLQHHGPRNEPPHPLCQRVLEKFLRRNGLRQEIAI